MICERKGHFLIGEWKKPNENMATGQQLLLKAFAQVPKFTVLVIIGNTDNEQTEVEEYDKSEFLSEKISEELEKYFQNNPEEEVVSWDDENATYILIGDGLNVKTRRNEYNNWASEPYRALGWATGKEIKERGVFDTKYNYWMLPLDNTNKMGQL